MVENIVKVDNIFVCTRKNLSLRKDSSMNENIESVKRYNLWYGNT